jgi:tetratricopeptide (TPR) repeat protein
MLSKINISPDRQKLIIYLVLTIVTLAVYWQVNHYDFVNYDDQVYVTENSHIQSGITLGGFRWAFSTIYAEFWHPLTLLSLMFDYQLHGLNAGGYHLTNLILHIMSTLLLFWLFNRMTGAIWRSAFIAAIFSLHPLRVESVAWIAERKDVLSAFFWMLTLCLYVYYTEKPVIKRYLLAFFGFVCGLMSKSMVVTLPVIMILLDYWPLGRLQLKNTENNLAGVAQGKRLLWLLWEKIPYFILSAVFSILTIYAQPKVHMPGRPYPLESRIINAIVSFVIYLEKTFWPYDLSVCYPFFGQVPVFQVLIAISLIFVISVVIIVTRKRLPYLFVGWMWYSITILPVIGIIPVGNNAMGDRYIYLPSVGIFIMLAWGTPLLFKSEDLRKNILLPAGVFFIAILAFLTWHQCIYWENSGELWSHALHVTKNNNNNIYQAHNGLALALFAEGKTDQAFVHYNEAIRLKPDNVLAYNNRGTTYNILGQNQRALEDYTKAIFLQPDHFLAYYNRGSVYAKLGQYQRAIKDFNKGLSLQPHYSVYNSRGFAYAQLGQYQRAIEDFNTAIGLKPDYAKAYINRALAYFNQKNIFSGCCNARKACALGNCKILEDAKGKGLCR